MVKRKPYLFGVAAAIIVSLVIHLLPDSSEASLPISGYAISASAPSPLSDKDRNRYAHIFALQKKADWAKSGAVIAKLDNNLLLGHVYAERYLHSGYKATAAELSSWLANYADHPQAHDIAALASAKSLTIPPLVRRNNLQGYGDDNGLAASFGDSKHAATWRMGINAWKQGNKAAAAKYFTTMLKDTKLPDWKVSAAAFWASRSYNALGNKKDAARYLTLAASKPRSFYGILARKQLRQPLGLDSDPVKLDPDALEAPGKAVLQRVAGLSETGRADLAEKELRARFPQAPREEKLMLLAMAHEINLASVQISMARQLATADRPLDFARYPVPGWEPQSGFRVDPALIYAVVRQESGFRPSAVSPAGAAGLMQLMPQTASFMKKRLAKDTARAPLLAHEEMLKAGNTDPTLNITLGQHYVQHLLENELVNGNLVYMLVAYNAGAGRLSTWKNSLGAKNDPLLFIENIPFAETRHYVMQVMTNYWIYSELAGNSTATASALVSGQWPRYDTGTIPVATGMIRIINDNAS